MFTSSSNSPIGLDISDLSLKVVQLNKQGDKIKIQALGKKNLAKGLISDGEIKNQEKVINKINELINHPEYGKINSNDVIACLPETKTFIKLIEIAKTPNPLAEIIESEIEKHIPMQISDIYYDWQIIDNKLDKQKVLIGVAPRRIIDQYMDLLDKAKLFTTALEIEPLSICRALLKSESPKIKKISKTDLGNYGIIDIGAKRTSLTVYALNTILFTFSMPISGENITQNIADILKISFEQAEKAKIICGLNENKAQGIIKNILSDTIDQLIKKIEEAIDYYNNHFSDRGPIVKFLLCGGGANIQNLDGIISQKINIKVERGNALINLSENIENFSKYLTETHKTKDTFSKNEAGKKIISIAQDTSLSYATAIGLALRGIFIEEI